jgi:hypothetical protein
MNQPHPFKRQGERFKDMVINALKLCPNVSPPVPEQCLLAFSASSQYSHRSNSES